MFSQYWGHHKKMDILKNCVQFYCRGDFIVNKKALLLSVLLLCGLFCTPKESKPSLIGAAFMGVGLISILTGLTILTNQSYREIDKHLNPWLNQERENLNITDKEIDQIKSNYVYVGGGIIPAPRGVNEERASWAAKQIKNDIINRSYWNNNWKKIIVQRSLMAATTCVAIFLGIGIIASMTESKS